MQIQEINLPDGPFRLFVPDYARVEMHFRQLKEKNGREASPYWAKLWPSAIALATFIQQNPGYVSGLWVAELAAGIGLPSLVSASFAKTVWCSDLVAEAAGVAAQSALLNGFTNMETVACNWEHIPGNLQPDVLLLSDVNYQPEVFGSLQAVIYSFLEKGITIILATPQRLVAKPFIEQLLPYVAEQTVKEIWQKSGATAISIFVLRKT